MARTTIDDLKARRLGQMSIRARRVRRYRRDKLALGSVNRSRPERRA